MPRSVGDIQAEINQWQSKLVGPETAIAQFSGRPGWEETVRQAAAEANGYRQNIAALQQEMIQAQRTQETSESEAQQQKLLQTIPELEQQIGTSLLNQQQFALEKARPIIEQSLAARGILSSGALPEALARQFRELEAARQGRIADFGIRARELARIGLPLQQFQSGIDLARSGLQRQFQLSDIGRQEDFQRQQLGLAQNLSERRRQAQRSASLARLAGTGIGAVAGGYFGGLPGAQFGAQTGGAFGEGIESLF